MILRTIAVAVGVFLSFGVGGEGTFAEVPAMTVEIEAQRSAIERRLQDVERDIERSRADDAHRRSRGLALEEEIRGLRNKLIAAGESILSREREILRLKGQIASLAENQAKMHEHVAGQRENTARILLALQRVARLPVGAVVARPLRPIEVVRTGIVLGAVVDDFARRTDSARQESKRMALVRNDVADRRRELSIVVSRLHEERGHLATLLDDSAALKRRLATESLVAGNQSDRLAMEAEDLKQLLDELDGAEKRSFRLASTDPSLPRQPTIEFGGHDTPAFEVLSRLPVDGRIILGFGEVPADGTASKGVRVETPSEASVAALAAGRVAFAGPFRGYGLLLIVEHDDGYHSLMAGLARIDLGLDQRVVAGEPVGAMGAPSEGNPTLYIELRREGQPVNPLPWLVQENGKASG
ncbi:MAG: peptidoglycan DD-metalloendopeptidase family protein [Rhodospirillales bacterium]|nr:peptidoglycan DD-metalloendopeptidase family protein [Rhodospirillales bacterium]